MIFYLYFNLQNWFYDVVCSGFWEMFVLYKVKLFGRQFDSAKTFRNLFVEGEMFYF